MKDRAIIIIFFAIGIIATLGVSMLYTAVIAPALAPPPTLDQLYTSAIEDAMIAKNSEVVNNLSPILQSNTNLMWQGEGDNATVLVVAFTRFASSYPVGENITTKWGDTWVTVAPEIQQYFKEHVSKDVNYTVRVAQLLGLPANTSNCYFVELWVNPESLFRPAPDNEITDTTASLTFPSNVTADYKAWYNGNIIYSYYPYNFPWTRLGYTYDWGNSASHVGLSEYVLRQNSTAIVKSITSTNEYLSSP